MKRPNKKGLEFTLNAYGQNVAQVAEFYQVHKKTVYDWIKLYKVEFKKYGAKRRSLEEDIEILKFKYFDQGWTQKQIADEWECDASEVSRIFVKEGLTKSRGR